MERTRASISVVGVFRDRLRVSASIFVKLGTRGSRSGAAEGRRWLLIGVCVPPFDTAFTSWTGGGRHFATCRRSRVRRVYGGLELMAHRCVLSVHAVLGHRGSVVAVWKVPRWLWRWAEKRRNRRKTCKDVSKVSSPQQSEGTFPQIFKI